MILSFPDKILVENLCQGQQSKYKISWTANPLASSYNIYISRVPYGEPQLLESNIHNHNVNINSKSAKNGGSIFTDGRNKSNWKQRVLMWPKKDDYWEM